MEQIEQKVSLLEKKANDLVNRVNDLETIRSPEEVVQRVCNIEVEIDEIRTAISDINIKLNSYLKEDKYIELFTDEEFKQLYMNSGFVAKDVAKLIEKKFTDVDTTPSSISRIINGERGSVELRSYLGKQFRYEIAKRKNV